MTFRRHAVLALAFVAYLLAFRAFAFAQVVMPRPVVPVSVTPMGATPVPLLPGGRYTFELPPPIPSGPQVTDLVSPTPTLTVTPLPTGDGGAIRREVTVSENAPPGETEMRVVTDTGEQS